MSAKGKGQLVNRSGVADMFGVALTTVDTWVRAGCPVVQRGSRGVEWSFNTADVARWREDERAKQAAGAAPQDEDELRKRRMVAETLTAELTLAKARGEVAPIDQVERMMARAFAEVRAGMRNIPGRVVSLLIGETNERQFKQVLKDEIDQVLESLSNADISNSQEKDEEDDFGADNEG
jgi:phage terminase Nu1 subunit (DNA packaging protein)